MVRSDGQTSFYLLQCVEIVFFSEERNFPSFFCIGTKRTFPRTEHLCLNLTKTPLMMARSLHPGVQVLMGHGPNPSARIPLLIHQLLSVVLVEHYLSICIISEKNSIE